MMRFTRRWERVCASLVDGVILGGPWWAMVAFIDFYKFYHVSWLGTIISAAYFVLLEGSLGHGQTAGKRLFGIRALRTDGNVLSYKDSFKRYFYFRLVPYLSTVPLLFLSTAWM